MSDIPVGLCQCGCGQTTTIPKKTARPHQRFKGVPVRFVKGHGVRILRNLPNMRSLEERIWERVEKTETCWIWQGATRRPGYGVITIAKDAGGRPIQQAVHRLVYTWHKGPIPPGYGVLHHCDRPRCVHPDHLYAGTQPDNVRDMLLRDRFRLARWDIPDPPRSRYKRVNTNRERRRAKRDQRAQQFISARRAARLLTPTRPRSRSLEERLWENIEKTEYCWLWYGARSKHGYGRITVGKTADGRFPIVSVHRLVYGLTYGPIPEGMDVLHHCDTPPCCRPDHLYLGTAKENIRDYLTRHGAVRMGANKPRGDQHYARREPHRLARGEEHGCHKLTADEVRQIRSLTKDLSMKSLSTMFKVTISTIHNVIRFHTWKHI